MEELKSQESDHENIIQECVKIDKGKIDISGQVAESEKLHLELKDPQLELKQTENLDPKNKEAPA